MDAAVAHATSTFGSLDVLVNNARIATGAALTDFTDQMWSMIIGTKSQWRLLQDAGRHAGTRGIGQQHQPAAL